MLYQISVTEEHIDLGIRNYREHKRWCASCPVAEAMKDAGIKNPEVGAFVVVCDTDGPRIAGNLPKAAHDFVVQFDKFLEKRADRPLPVEFAVEVG